MGVDVSVKAVCDAESLLAELQSAGVRLWIEGGRLGFDGPVSDAQVDRMRAHRDELLGLIESAGPSSDDSVPDGCSVASSIVCPWCRSADLVDDPEGLRCEGCGRPAWTDLPGGGWERVDRAELDLVEVDPDSVPLCSGCGRLCDVDRGPGPWGAAGSPGSWACSRCDPGAEGRRRLSERWSCYRDRLGVRRR